MSQPENTLDADQEITWRRAHVLGILIAALMVAEITKDVVFSSDLGNWLPVGMFLYHGVIACLPFVLARIAPKAAGFDRRWLPRSRWHWVWFLGMVILLIVAAGLVAALAVTIVGHRRPRPFVGPVTPIGIISLGIVIVFTGPVAEEIFFRGYVLEQLRKLTRSGVALLIQALLFGLFHHYSRGLFTSLALFSSLSTFSYGMILGAWRIKFRSLLPLVLAHVLLNAATGIAPLEARYDQAIGRLHPIRHTISKETTYITEPLRKDGSVDYVAALNQRASEGVTPENNAAVLFWKAMGPEEILPEYRDRYFQMLGIPPLPEKGDYFVNLERYLAQQKEIAKSGGAKSEPTDAYDLLEPALKRPWSRQEFAVLAAWLAANEKPLALVVEASKRPRRYDPLVCGERTPLIAVLQPAIQHYRDVAGALCARAMLQLDEGKLEEAWEGLLSCHRLARLDGQGQTLVEALTAFSREETACAGDRALLQHAPLTAPQAAKMREDLDRLPAMPKFAGRLDAAERFLYLDNVSFYSRQGAASLTWCVDAPELDDVPELRELESTIKSLIHYSAITEIDWDLILRMGNSWFDRIVDAYRKPTRSEQKEALRKLDEDFQGLKKTAQDAESLDKLMLGNPHEALSERFSQVLLSIFLPPITVYIDVEDRWTMRLELDKVGVALAAYHADHGAYPTTLAALAPDYVVEVPKDIFNDSELHYQPEDKGYLLYSVGVNEKDDGAKSYEDCKKDEDWDDLVVRMPAPAREEK